MPNPPKKQPHAPGQHPSRADAAPLPARILVVDDQPAIILVLRNALSSVGYAVECASEAEEALNKLDAGIPDLLITDLQLDDMDGLQLARELKRRSPDTPVIVMTGWRPAVEEMEGADLFLPKPFNVKTLLKITAEALSRRNTPEA